MILGIGTDLIEIERVTRALHKFNSRFANRIFTPGEQHYANSTYRPAATYAKRFAAKEACLKALGTGRSHGILWTDVEVYNDHNGQPNIRLHNQAKQFVIHHFKTKLENLQIHVSLTDTQAHAQAFIIISMVIH